MVRGVLQHFHGNAVLPKQFHIGIELFHRLLLHLQGRFKRFALLLKSVVGSGLFIEGKAHRPYHQHLIGCLRAYVHHVFVDYVFVDDVFT